MTSSTIMPAEKIITHSNKENDMEQRELKEAIAEGRLWDFIANEYPNLSKWELKEILLAILGVVYDNCGGGTATGDDEYLAFQARVEEELHERFFFDEDSED